jgi:hypothetical protein
VRDALARPPRAGQVPSPLETAVEAGSHALALLLHCNGYDRNLEEDSPLDLAPQARRWDLLDLLLDWGADRHRLELEELFAVPFRPWRSTVSTPWGATRRLRSPDTRLLYRLRGSMPDGRSVLLLSSLELLQRLATSEPWGDKEVPEDVRHGILGSA